jgi:hypothetical protein
VDATAVGFLASVFVGLDAFCTSCSEKRVRNGVLVSRRIRFVFIYLLVLGGYQVHVC